MLAEIAELTERNSHLSEQVDGLKAQVQNIAKAHGSSRDSASVDAAAAAAVLAVDGAHDFPSEVRIWILRIAPEQTMTDISSIQDFCSVFLIVHCLAAIPQY